MTEITLERFCGALISSFAYFVALLIWIVGLVVTINTLLHAQLLPAIQSIVSLSAKAREKTQDARDSAPRASSAGEMLAPRALP